MKIISNSEKFNYLRVVEALWLLAVFSLPFSTALLISTTILATLFSIGLIIYERNLLYTFDLRLIFFSLGFFLLIMLSIFWSAGIEDEIKEGAWKYRKIIILNVVALVVVIFNSRLQIAFERKIFWAFLIACGLNGLVMISIKIGIARILLGEETTMIGWYFFGNLEQHMFSIGNEINPYVGRNHISQGFNFATGLVLTGYLYNQSKDSVKTILIFLAILFVVCILIMQGRTGYFLLGIVSFSWLFLRSEVENGNYASFTRWLVPLFLTLIYILKFDQINLVFNDVWEYLVFDNINSSQGYRLYMWIEGGRAFLSAPIFGHGVGSFPNIVGNPEFLPESSRSQPHSEVILILVQTGLAGILLFCGFVFQAWKNCECLWMRLYLQMFVAAMLINSVIFDLVEGHNFALVLGALLGSSIFRNSSRNIVLDK